LDYSKRLLRFIRLSKYIDYAQHYKILKFLDNGGNIINLLCLAVKYGRTVCRLLDPGVTSLHIQRVTEISTFILTGNRTHQKEQLFSLPFWRKTLRNGVTQFGPGTAPSSQGVFGAKGVGS
jgi:hypothetical protein